MKFKYELGLEAEDIITGFKGFITYRVEYLTGCPQYGLQPKMKKGDKEVTHAKQFDENSLRLTGKSISLPNEEEVKKEFEKAGKTPPGGPKTIVKSSKDIK